MSTNTKNLLARIQLVHAFILDRPGCTMLDICNGLNLKHTAVRYTIYAMEFSGHIETLVGKRCFQGQPPNRYTVINEAIPDTLSTTQRARAKLAEQDSSRDLLVKRRFTKARQLGTMRDPLVAALFGAAVRA